MQDFKNLLKDTQNYSEKTTVDLYQLIEQVLYFNFYDKFYMDPLRNEFLKRVILELSIVEVF